MSGSPGQWQWLEGGPLPMQHSCTKTCRPQRQHKAAALTEASKPEANPAAAAADAHLTPEGATLME